MAERRAKLLLDMLNCVKAIVGFTENRTLDDYAQNLMLRSAIERQFEIIGEAMRRLSNESPEFAARFTQAGAVIAFRNLIAHGYDIIDGHIV